jgi:hypothetical protein
MQSPRPGATNKEGPSCSPSAPSCRTARVWCPMRRPWNRGLGSPYAYYRLSLDYGQAKAKERLQALKEVMTPGQIAQAEAAAADMAPPGGPGRVTKKLPATVQQGFKSVGQMPAN